MENIGLYFLALLIPLVAQVYVSINYIYDFFILY